MAGIFVEEATSRLSVKVPVNADGNIAQTGETGVKTKSISIKGFVDNGSLSHANDVFDAFLGNIANTNYDSLTAVRYDTAKVEDGKNQGLRVDDSEPQLGENIGDNETVNVISAVPTDTALILTFTPANPEFFDITVSGRAITLTRTKAGEFNTTVTVKSDEVAGYASATTNINVDGF